MQILSHRGYWTEPGEKNRQPAFARALQFGFGIETDLRDAGSQTVISHDPPASDAMLLDDFLALCAQVSRLGPLALNIKADGLQRRVRDGLERHGINSAFVFDMSVPDTLGYLQLGVPVFVRQSEVEPQPVLYERASGIWLDQFHADWVSAAGIFRHLEQGKPVCLVSPELHRRDPLPQWERLAASEVAAHDNFMLCTDFPVRAREVFNV